MASTTASRVELELSIAKAFGMYPVGNYWFDPDENALRRFDGARMDEVAALDDSVRNLFMVPDAMYTWTYCKDPRCVLSIDAHSGRACQANITDLLTVAYEAWMNYQRLELASAEEVLCRETLTDDQRKWLVAFVNLWEASE